MFIKLYLIALPVFLLIDMIWLGLVAKNFYAKHLGYIMRPDVNWLAAIIFYLIFIVGLVWFVVTPALDKGSWANALLSGALGFRLCSHCLVIAYIVLPFKRSGFTRLCFS